MALGPASGMARGAAGLDPTGLAIDARGLDRLKAGVRTDGDAAIRQAARQFEATFLKILLSSMRASLPGDPLAGGGGTQNLATGMLDEQWAQSLSGRGLGLAELMARQLGAGKGQGGAHAAGIMSPAGAPGAAGPATPVGATGVTSAPLAEAAATAPTMADVASPGARGFVRRMLPHAEQAATATGVPAHFILGQAALETGWGKREIRAADGSNSHNLFGIKAGAGWTGPVAETLTTEYSGGVAHKVVQRFRAYASYTEAFSDYANLLKSSPRYAAALTAGDARGFAGKLQAGGYATDPAYASKLSATINQTLALRGSA